MTDLNSIQE